MRSIFLDSRESRAEPATKQPGAMEEARVEIERTLSHRIPWERAHLPSDLSSKEPR